jgi:chromosome segregation ATPase
MQAENSALRSHLEKEIEDTLEKLDAQVKKCQEQDDRIKQLREELAANRKLLADNQKKDDEIIASSKAEVEALKAKVLEMGEKLIEVCKAHENELADMNAANAVLKAQLCFRQEGIETLKAQVSALEKQLEETQEEGKDQIERLEARIAVLDRELEGAALVSEHESICWKLYT